MLKRNIDIGSSNINWKFSFNDNKVFLFWKSLLVVTRKLQVTWCSMDRYWLCNM